MKKFALFLLLAALSLVFSGCSLLKTIAAVKGFSEEYDKYSEIYESTDHLAVISDTELNVVETDLDGIEPISLSLDMKFDFAGHKTYLNQERNGVSRESVIDSSGGSTIEYTISEGIVSASGLDSVSDSLLHTNVLAGDSSFSLDKIDNEMKTGEHSYSLDIELERFLNLSALTQMVNNLQLLPEAASELPNASAHLDVSFTETESVIDISLTLDDYRIDFASGKHLVLDLSSHTVVSIPESMTIVDVFSDDFIHNPAPEIKYATKVNHAGDNVAIPFNDGQSGWICFELEPGTYKFVSASLSNVYSSYMVTVEGTQIPYSTTRDVLVTIGQEGLCYLHIGGNSSQMLYIQLVKTAA